MDYKEKYEQALERAKIWQEHLYEVGDKDYADELNYIFPELKESEDELEWLKQFLQEEAYILSMDIRDDEDSFRLKKLQKSLEWLKKQEGNLVENGYTDNKDIIKYADNYSHEIWRKLMDNFENIKNYHIGCNDVSDIVLNAIIDTYNWLEKQGESIKIKKGKNYLCTKTHKYAGVEWIEGVKYYSPEDYSLVNQGCTCYCPKYSKEEHNNFFKEVEYDGCLEKQGESIDDNIITRDDEILQAISIGLTDAVENFGWSNFGGLPIKEIQEWLKKQGGQEPIEWKDSDEKYLFWALLSIQKDIAASEINGVNTKDLNDCVKWLYSIKRRIGG